MSPPRHADIQQYSLHQVRKLRPLISQLAYPIARRNRVVYASLLHSNYAQQFLVKAAHTVHARVLDLFPGLFATPIKILNVFAVFIVKESLE